MKVCIEFILPEESEEYAEYMQGVRGLDALRELADAIRQLSKGGVETVEVEKLSLKFWDIVNEHDVILW